MNLLNRITIDPQICHGKPCIRGMRSPVEAIIDILGAGMAIDHKNMKRFRLPRKIKKSLKGELWLYPANEKGNQLLMFFDLWKNHHTTRRQRIV